MTNKLALRETYSKQLTQYFIVTILITWFLWLPSVLNAMAVDIPDVLLIVSMTASFTPTIVGLLFLRKELGRDEFKGYLKNKLAFNFSKTWLLAIPAIFFGAGALSYGLTFLLVETFEPINRIPLAMTPLVFLQILVIGGAFGEEFGWRGFAQGRLQSMYSPMLATLILGLIWSLWHLPLFFMEGTVQSSMPIWQFMLQNTLIAFFYTWVYNKTRGNILLMIYLHAVANTSAAIFPYWQDNTGRFIGLSVLVITCVSLYKIWPIENHKQ